MCVVWVYVYACACMYVFVYAYVCMCVDACLSACLCKYATWEMTSCEQRRVCVFIMYVCMYVCV